MEKAFIIGTRDDRVPMASLAKGPRPVINQFELEKIRHSTGMVRCPGRKHNNPGKCSAALVESDQTIVTAVHCFFDEFQRWREPLSECTFSNFANPQNKIPLDFKSSHFFTTNPNLEPNNDRVVVRLSRKIEGARPFHIDFQPVREGEFLLVASIFQQGMVNPVPESEPVGQVCFNRMTHPASEKEGSLLIADCDSSFGGSGALVLTRRFGVLVAVGTLVAVSGDSMNYHPFDPVLNRSRILGFDSHHWARILSFVASSEQAAD